MEFQVKGKKGDPARVALKLDPADIGTLLIGEAPNLKILAPSIHFQEIGKIPCTVKLMFLLNTRPWKIQIQQEGGTLFSSTNKQQGLDDKVLLTPDIINVTLVYDEN
jgi:hypothetical protein